MSGCARQLPSSGQIINREDNGNFSITTFRSRSCPRDTNSTFPAYKTDVDERSYEVGDFINIRLLGTKNYAGEEDIFRLVTKVFWQIEICH